MVFFKERKKTVFSEDYSLDYTRIYNDEECRKKERMFFVDGDEKEKTLRIEYVGENI
jgi:hypothetical protein